MEPLTAASLFLTAVFAGTFGSMLGLGGGIIIIPALTLLFGVGIREAAATSLLCVVATSTAATINYLKQRLTDLRLGLLLELPTVLGAIAGGYIAFAVPKVALQIIFALLLLYVAYVLWRDTARGVTPAQDVAAMRDTSGLCLRGVFHDPALGREVEYTARHFTPGMLASAGAGILSGMLGVGGGIIKVPVMRLKMGVPMKVSVATSNFMIGITGATSVMLYFQRGFVNLSVTAVCALGILLGATIGPRLAARIHTTILQRVFIVVLLLTAVQMVWKAIQGGGG